MSTNEDRHPLPKQTTPSVSPGNYTPVTVIVNNIMGSLFLGLVELILLVGWMRSGARYRKLIVPQEITREILS